MHAKSHREEVGNGDEVFSLGHEEEDHKLAQGGYLDYATGLPGALSKCSEHGNRLLSRS